MIDMDRSWICISTLAVIVACGTAGVFAQANPRDGSKSPPKKRVLVELFTSQGCDMCPDAERLLGALAEDDPGIVPVALHVDYFNDPWVDPFSDKAFSQRQGAYNGLYRQPKNPEYGIYYTPMLMIDGKESVNGRDRAAALAAIRRARARKPEVALDARLGTKPGDPRSGTLDVGLASPSPGVAGRKLLVGAMVRHRSAVTHVGSGENARKDLTNRYPARAFQFQYVTLKDDGKRADLAFPLRIERSWDLDQLDVIVFVQDNGTGAIHQAEAIPWSPERAIPASQPPGRARDGDRADRPASG
jgi:hypothetical protein